MLLLRSAIKGHPTQRVISLCSGDLRGRAGRRLILDRREVVRSSPDVIAVSLQPQTEPIEGIDTAVLWPRAHLGKDFALRCIAMGLLALGPQGRLLCAVRKQKGADSIADFMAKLFGNVRTLERSRGYRLLQSEASADSDFEAAKNALTTRYVVTDPLVEGLEFETAAGVFSRRGLDVGTRCLIEHVERLDVQPHRVVDLCAGWGALGLWAAKRWSDAQVMLVESNYLASELAERNARANGFDERVTVLGLAGLPKERADGVRWHGTVDMLLVNPPTHADAGALEELFAPLPKWLREGARCYAVAARPQAVRTALDRAGALSLVHQYDRFSIVEAWFESA